MHMNGMNVASMMAVCCLALARLAFAEEGASGTVRVPGPWHHVNNRAHVGIPSVAISQKNGRMWATWYGGVTPGEDSNNYVVLATSGDGQTWREVLVADPDGIGPRRAFDPEVWISPDGLLRWTWTERVAPLQSESDNPWAGCAANPRNDDLMMAVLDAENEPSGEPPKAVRIGRGVMMCKPMVRGDGMWLFPVAHWFEAPSSCLLATTNGVEFTEIGGATVPKGNRSFDEHTLVERADGALWMLTRTHKGLSESLSKDGGRTWDECEESGLGHPSARLFLRRLASGRLLLVKHGAIGERTGRTKLMAFLSEDDGVTWQGGLLLDGRSGVSYPDGDQFADGTIAVVYDFSRLEARNVCMAVFTEEDVLAARNVSGKLALNRVISSRDTSDPDWTGVDPRLGRSLDPDGRTMWISGRHFPREGRAFASAPPFARIPHKLEGKLSPQAIHAGQDSAGVSFRFTSDSPRLVFEWSLLRAPLAPPPSPEANRCGIDVYGRADGGGWEFVANGPSAKRFGNRLELEWKPGRDCRVYLPAAVGVRDFRVGVPRGASFSPPTPVADKPVVFFGTGNFQGVAASRPGLVLSAAVGRALDMPTINLGLSGVDSPEPKFLELLASIDAAAYVFDSAWGAADAKATLSKWAQELRASRPEAPVLFAADILKVGGDATIDGARLNDHGVVEMARACAEAIRRAASAPPPAKVDPKPAPPPVAKDEPKPAPPPAVKDAPPPVPTNGVSRTPSVTSQPTSQPTKPKTASPAEDPLPGLEDLMGGKNESERKNK